MRMLKRIALVMCVVTAASVLTGCGGDEDPKKKEGEESKKGKGGKKGLKKAKGTTISTEESDGDGGANKKKGGAGKKKPPAPGPPAKVLSNVEKIQGIRERCLGSLDSDLKDVKPASVCEKLLGSMLKIHKCVVEMGTFVVDADSASVQTSGSTFILNRLWENIETLRLPSNVAADQDICFAAVHEKGSQFLANMETGTSTGANVDIAKKETAEMLKRIYSISEVYPHGKGVFHDISDLKTRLKNGLTSNHPEMQNIHSIFTRFRLILVYVQANIFLPRQRERVITSTVEHVKKTLSEIEKPAKASNSAPFFVELTRFAFQELVTAALQEQPNPVGASPLLGYKDVVEVATATYTKLFKAYIASFNSLENNQIIDALNEAVKDERNKLQKIYDAAGTDAAKQQVVLELQTQIDAARDELVNGLNLSI